MSKTKTKRMVASFLLLCAMSGTKVLAMPDDWNPGNDLATTNQDWIQDGTVTIDDAEFINKGTNTVAPIFIGGSNTTPVNVIFTADNLKFEGNSTPGAGSSGGGAMYFGSPGWASSNNDQTITIQGISQFIENSTGSESLVGRTPDGGAIYTTSKMDFIGNASFQGNDALGQPGGDNVGGRGGAIYSNAQLNFNNGALFQGNTASTYGGAIYVGNQGELTVTGGATFSGNQAGSQGGAIYNNNKVTLDATGGDITFSNNTVNGKANDIYLDDKRDDNPAWGPASDPASLTLKGTGTITFNGSILGEDGTTITNSANDLILNGDNTDYAGIFTQTGGKTTVNGKFFGGTNVHQINGGSLVIAAANAIDGSKIVLNKTSDDVVGNIDIQVDTTLTGNVTGEGNITLNKENTTLTLEGNNSVFTGNYTQSNGALVVGDGSNETTSFSGTNNINGGSVTVTNNATLLGTNTISGDSTKVDLKSGSTLAGTNKINGGTVNINTSDNTGANNTINGGVVNVGNEAKTTLAGTNSVAGGELKIFSGSTLSGANTSLTSGAISLDNAVLNGLKEMTDGTLTLNNGEITGTVNIGGGSLNATGSAIAGTVAQSGTSTSELSGVTIAGTYNIADGTLDINGNSTISAGGVLDIDGGTVNMNQSIALTDGNITGDGGTLNMTQGNTDLTISGNQSGFKGDFNKTGGTINIGTTTTSGSTVAQENNFFSGSSNLSDTTVNMKDNSSIALGSGENLTLDNTDIVIENSGLNSQRDQYDVAQPNGNESLISGTVKGDDSSSIIVNGENTYLQISGDMSGFTGDFVQENGTTEVVDGIFFGGTNEVKDGNFIFRDEASLSSDVTISGEDVTLTIGDGSKAYQIVDGNKVNVDGGQFILENVNISGSILEGGTEDTTIGVNDSNVAFGENGGLSGSAHYELGKGGGASAHYTMEDKSVAQDGSSLVINSGSVLDINANTMNTITKEPANPGDAYEFAEGGSFGTDLKGAGTVNTENTITDKAQALNFTSDNSEFNGTYTHKGGIIQFSGSEGNEAKFFNGNNYINDGRVIFAANSVVMGNNTVNDNGYFELTDGSVIDKDNNAQISLGNAGTLDITNTSTTDPLNLNISVGGSTTVDEITGAVSAADINKTDAGALTISADQHEYTGNYTQTGTGTVTVNAGKSFFGGKNNINKGTVDLTAEGAKVAGQNTISSTSDTVGGKMQIGDKTDTTSYLNNPIIVNTVADDEDHGLELVTTDGNDQNLEVAFAIASGADNTGRVTHSGNGTLNLNNAGQNDLFKDFNGTFAQTSTGVTNVFGNSFKNNDIQNGTLNMKNGSTLADGTTNLGDNGTLNIGAFDGDTTFIPEGQEDKYNFDANSTVTINSDIKGTGKVNISDGKTTITALSNNSGLTGTYHQTGGEVVAQSGSTFFGATVKNLIEKGKLFFNKGANLASGANVTLDANTDMSGQTENTTAVLDLDGRDNAKFTGGNTLYIDGKDTEGFVFTDGVLQNALLHGEQNIGDNTVITMQGGSGFAGDAVATIGGTNTNVILGTGSVAEEGADLTVDSTLTLVSENLDFKSEVVGGSGNIRVEKDMRETNAPNINIYGDQSAFEGSYYQDAGRVTVKNGATFFGGSSNEVTGLTETDAEGNVIKETSGDLYLEKGSLIGSDITITNFDKTANAGVSTPHGRVFIEDKIYDSQGNELTDIDKLMDGDLYYNTSADGSAVEQHNIKVENAGLILSNGTIFDGSDGPTVFENKGNGGVVDIGFSNGTGVDGDIVLKRDTMLSYGDNAYIKDDSTLEMEDTAILNFINDTADITYRPDIVGGGSIYKEGLATTNITSAIDMTGEVKVSEGTLNFTNKDKVIFNKGDDLNLRQTGNLTVGSGSSNASISIVAKDTVFGGDVTSDAQDGTQSTVALNGKNTTIGGNLINNNTNLSILGNSSIGGDWTINGNSGLNLVGNYSNTIDVAGDLIIGDSLKDGKLPVAFDYDPHRGTMDTINVDSFVNDSNSPLLITGINFVTSPVDRNFDLSADRLIQQRNPEDTPYYDATSFYANTAMGRYFLSNGAGGADFTGTLVHLNPQQYRGQVATIASWQNQLLINNLLFDHMGLVTRQLMEQEKTANKYAATIPQFAPYQYDLKGGSLWYKAYGNFETLSMTKGLSVGNNAYGALIGADFPLIKLKHGWNIVPTAYIGYNGAHQHFNGVSMYQNGAQLGFMGTAYKGNFLTSLLAYGGGYGNDMSMHGEYGSGSDNTGNWFAGVASKSAYNIHLPADFILQPTVMAAYNAFGSQNWGSDFGVMSMSSGMLNGVNVAPGVNLIWQKKSFNIYLTAQMVYNIMGGVDGRAGNIDLGYVRMRHSYFEYGLGVSKNFKDRFGGFLQFVIRNGGRTGIGFSGGLQFKLGK